MADFIDTKTRQFLKDLVREAAVEATNDIRKEIVGLKQTAVRTEQKAIVNERQTAELQEQVTLLRLVQGQQNIFLRAIQTTVNSLKTGFRSQTKEMVRLNVLLEDMQYRWEASHEL